MLVLSFCKEPKIYIIYKGVTFQQMINFYDKMLTYHDVALQFTLTGFIMSIIVYFMLNII